jgi:hypothetical protein
MSKTFSYDPSLDTDRDWIRWRTGDTDCDDPLQWDEEIDAAVAQAGNRSEALLEVVDAILAKVARKVDSKMGKLELSLSQLYDRLRNLRDEVDAEVRRTIFASPRMVAHKRSLKETQILDDDRVRPAFRRNMNEREPTDSDLVDERYYP